MPEVERRCEVCEAPLPDSGSSSVCQACMLERALDEDSYIELTEIQPGRVIKGYRIVRKLGIGGMGVVYEAYQESLSRSVALKMIRAPSSASSRDMARFRQEAEAAARLNHPDIVEVYEIGELQGCPFFTMKYVDGARSLGSELAKGPFDAQRAARLVSRIARAVSYAHQRGVIHRDLKPANILLHPDGRPCLVDFGLAKLFGESPSLAGMQQALSDDGKLMGTPHYMSPEQIRAEELTTSTDVYSLGIVLYELITGAPPFRSRALNDMLDDISHTSPKPPNLSGSTLSRDLEVICLKCLRKQPQNRYASADELADDLDRWLDKRPILARPSTTADRVSKWARRHPGVAALSALVIVLTMVLIGVLGSLWRGSEKRNIATVTGPLDTAGRQRSEMLAGRRWRAIDALQRATANLSALPEHLRLGYRQDLQAEAIACLSLIDVRPSMAHGDSWEGDPDQCGLVTMRPDFESYAHAIADGSVVIRNRRSNAEELGLPNPSGRPCRSLEFDSRGDLLVAVHDGGSGNGCEFTVWDTKTADVLAHGPVNGPKAVALSDDGAFALIADGHEVHVVELDSSTPGRAPLRLPHVATCLSLNRDGSLLAASSQRDSWAAVLEFRRQEDSEAQSVSAFERFDMDVLDLAWNPRGRWLALASEDGRVMIWDTESPEGGATEDSVTLWGEGASAIEHVAWHPRGVLIAGTSSAEQVHLWHAAKGDREVTWTGTMAAPQFSPDAADGREPGAVRLGPVLDGSQVSLLEIAEGRVVSHARGHRGRIHNLTWRDRHGRLFATAGDDGVRLWNRRGFELAFLPRRNARAAIFTDRALITSADDGVTIRSLDGGGANSRSTTVRLGPPQRLLEGTPCFDMDYEPRSRRLAVATGDGVLVFQVDRTTGRFLDSAETTLTDLADAAFVDFNEEGTHLAAGSSSDRGMRVWQVGESWTPVKGDFPDAGATDVVFYQVPDEYGGRGHCLVACGSSEFKFFDQASWKFVGAIPARRGRELGSISFSPRTPVFAVSGDRFLSVYTLSPMRELIRPQFDSQEPISFSPQGIILTTTDRAKESHTTHLHLWDLRLLRTELDRLGLDLIGLRKFEELREPELIETVVVE